MIISEGDLMKRFLRILLFVFAIATGFLLGNLLIGSKWYKMCLFGVACYVFGYVFNEIDKIILSHI
jgi:hypothetical protein